MMIYLQRLTMMFPAEFILGTVHVEFNWKS